MFYTKSAPEGLANALLIPVSQMEFLSFGRGGLCNLNKKGKRYTQCQSVKTQNTKLIVD